MSLFRLITPIILIALLGLQGCAGPALVAGGTAAGAAALADRRPPEVIVSDRDIELEAGRSVYTDPSLKKAVHINFTCHNGVLLLTGEAPTEALRDQVVDYARRVANVRQVNNEIVIAEPSDLKSRSRDTWITTQVKSRMLADKELKSLHVRVTTERRTVYLMGIVTKREAAIATQIAREFSDVAQVVTIFEYVDNAADK